MAATVIKFLLILIFACIIFVPQLFTSRLLYWSAYFVMFVLIPMLWAAMYWVSRKKSAKILGTEPDNSFFAGKVSPDVNEDLTRGRLCFLNGKISLVGKQANKVSVLWSCNISDVKAVAFGKVAGARRGFTLQTGNGDISFTSGKVFKNRQVLYQALNWKFD